MAREGSLASVSATREVLQRHGLATKHALGQNFLVSDAVLRKIIDLAQVAPEDYVLEVGPGIGTLTIALLQHAGRVVSVERDADLVPVLAETTAPWADRFRLLNMDALQLCSDMLSVPAADGGRAVLPGKLVSNLPYAVAATVVLDCFQRFASLESATVMVQKEVADRMTAVPGTKNYGAYTVKLSLYAQAAGRFPVGAGNFFPPPRVESAVVRLDRRAMRDASGSVLDEPRLRAVCTMADAAFANRRKTLANSCKTYFAGDSAVTPDVLAALFLHAGIDPSRRGETLSLDEFVSLGEAYRQLVSL